MESKYKLPVIQPGAAAKSCHSQSTLYSPGRTLTLAQVQHEYPCDSCSAPCCTYLPLHAFNVMHMRELDHALYLLNFPRIELGINATGGWGVYYRYPCRFLNRETALCTIYGSGQRPSICAHYNPYSCWYKQVLGTNGDGSFLRIDNRRMEAVVQHLTFDENLNIVGNPDWSMMREMLAKLPLSPEYDESFDDDPVFDRWLNDAASGPEPVPAVKTEFSYSSLNNPCDGCGAFCCKYLVFPQAVPTTRVSLDFLHFALGFPGLEIGVSDDSWSVIVKTTCRHLSGNRCSIFGQPERPQICRFYDAHACSYVAQFGAPRPEGFMRIRLEQFQSLVEPIGFDEYGNIITLPETEILPQHIEQQLREQVSADTRMLTPPSLLPTRQLGTAEA
jgi:Fe-S-cluster containining protein